MDTDAEFVLLQTITATFQAIDVDDVISLRQGRGDFEYATPVFEIP